jgi:hypothetical protein
MFPPAFFCLLAATTYVFHYIVVWIKQTNGKTANKRELHNELFSPAKSSEWVNAGGWHIFCHNDSYDKLLSLIMAGVCVALLIRPD